MRILFLFLFTLLPLLAQKITPSSSSVIAQAGPDGNAIICTLTVPSVECTVPNMVNGVNMGPIHYMSLDTRLASGVDTPATVGRNGNIINFTISQAGTVFSWAVAVQPNGGAWTRQTGVFNTAGPPPVATVGSLLNGVCLIWMPGFVVSGSTINSDQTTNRCVM